MLARITNLERSVRSQAGVMEVNALPVSNGVHGHIRTGQGDRLDEMRRFGQATARLVEAVVIGNSDYTPEKADKIFKMAEGEAVLSSESQCKLRRMLIAVPYRANLTQSPCSLQGQEGGRLGATSAECRCYEKRSGEKARLFDVEDRRRSRAPQFAHGSPRASRALREYPAHCSGKAC